MIVSLSVEVFLMGYLFNPHRHYCVSDEEKKLVSIYQDEIAHLDSGGNPAVGSDILRWLKPCYELGTYSDFDTNINTQTLPSEVEVEGSLLLNIGSALQSFPAGEFEFLHINNDLIAVVSPDAEPLIKKIQTVIYNGCSPQKNDESVYRDYLKKDETYSLPSYQFEMLHKMSQGRSGHQVRSLILGETQVDEKDSPEIKKMKMDFRANMLKFSVMYSSGPGVFSHIFPDFAGPELFKSKVYPFAFSNYSLKEGFNSAMPLTLGCTQEAFLQKTKNAKFGEFNDLSWLAEGHEKVVSRESELKAAARVLLGFFRKRQATKINPHSEPEDAPDEAPQNK